MRVVDVCTLRIQILKSLQNMLVNTNWNNGLQKVALTILNMNDSSINAVMHHGKEMYCFYIIKPI